MSQEGGEKKEKRKPTTVLDELTNISFSLSEALNVYKQIEMQFNTVVQKLPFTKYLQELKSLNETLESISILNKTLTNYDIFLKAVKSSTAIRVMCDLDLRIRELLGSLARISDMIKLPSIPIAELKRELDTIPPRRDTLVRTLLKQIDLLEKELAEKEEEIKQLRELLKEKRKELKNQYVV